MAGFLESGCGLIVGLVRPDGVPFPCRAWGLDVLDASGGTVRVLVAAGELARVGVGRDELAAAVAVTGSTSAPSTVQVKAPSTASATPPPTT